MPISSSGRSVLALALMLPCGGSLSAQSAEASRTAPVTAPVMAPVPEGRRSALDLIEATPSKDFVVRRVGEVDINASDVFRMLDLAAPERSAEIIANMVLTIVAEQEALREGIDVPNGELESRVEEALARQSAQFALEGPAGLALENYLQEVHGMTPQEYREHVRRGVLSELLLARVSRLQQLRETRDTLQLILVQDEEVALEIRSVLDDGASFSVLAKKHSEHGSAQQGGLMPPITLDVTSPLLEGRETLSDGDVLGPAPITLGGTDYFRFLRLAERNFGVQGSWGELRAAVETDLALHPMNPDEVAIFEARMIARYRVTRPPAP
jgi:hypothetical protein